MRLLPILLLAPALLQSGAEAAEISYQSSVIGPSSVAMRVIAQNNDNGAIYDSMRFTLWGALATELYALPVNAAVYSSPRDLMDDWSMVVGTGGTVGLGWNLSANDALDVLGQHHNGDPGFDYDMMSYGSTFNAVVTIGASQLEMNAIAGWQPFTLSDVSDPAWNPADYDAIIVRSDSALLGASNHVGASEAGPREGVFVGTSASGFNSYPASGQVYVLLTPWDFAEWTDFGSEHGELESGGDANGNGVSNFVDYASGQDPEGSGLLAAVELTGTTLTLRRRVNGLDAQAVAEYSDDLEHWHALEEGVDYTVESDTVIGVMRTLVLEFLPGQPAVRFYRQAFGG